MSCDPISYDGFYYTTEGVKLTITKTKEECNDDRLYGYSVTVDLKITAVPHLVLINPHESETRHRQKEVAVISLRKVSNSVRVMPRQHQDRTRRILLDIVKTWALHPGMHEDLADEIYYRVRDIADSRPMSLSHNLFFVDVKVCIENKHYLHPGSVFHRILKETNLDRKFIPAFLMGYNALKGKRIEDQSESTNCSICLSEFDKGSEVSCMPCSHMFHTSCIEQWLMKSRYCPLCRFEMTMGVTGLSGRRITGFPISN